MSPDWEFTLHGDRVVGVDAVYQGIEGWRKFAQDWITVWEATETDPHRIIDVDDEHVLALVTLRGRARGGLELEVEYAHLYTIVDGVYTRLDGYPSWETGFRAAGLDPAHQLADK